MSSNVNLVSILTLDRFVVNVYEAANSANSLDPNVLSSTTEVLNSKEYPRGIVETLEIIEGVVKIEVFDKESNTLLLSSSLSLEFVE